MEPRPTPYLWLLAMCVVLVIFSSCSDIIQPSISKSVVVQEAPAAQYQSSSYGVNFWWDEVTNALSYHLQVVTPNFTSPGALVLDTIIKRNTFTYNFNPGNYQWRVMAENGSSQTAFAGPRNFTVLASSIKQQAVQLTIPANNTLTNQGNQTFQWGPLYGATKYQLEIDTNNFINENALVYNQTIPGQQISFTLPKDQVYEWRVKAQNDTAQSQWSAIYQLTFDHTPPVTVSLITPADGSTVSLPAALQWNASATAVQYKLYVYKSDGITLLSSTFPVSQTATSYSFNQGSSGTKFYWVVTAVDAAGNESQPGSLRSFTLQ
jgi:hypothetical protein